jgi:hypothetical protein
VDTAVLEEQEVLVVTTVLVVLAAEEAAEAVAVHSQQIIGVIREALAEVLHC